MPRTLTEPEFNAIKAKLLDAAPSGLKEDEFNRYIGPAMAQAVGEAENSTGPVVGSAAERFASGAWKILNPMGLVNAAMHPIDTAKAMVGAQIEQGQKALELAKEGRYTEAAGHGAAALLPMVGPAAANAGERIASGDVAGGLGEGAALLAPAAASAGRVPIGKATSAVGRTAEAVGKSSPVRRIGTYGAAAELFKGDIPKAVMAGVAPIALEKGGQALQRVGDALSGANAPVVSPETTPPHLDLSQRVPAGSLTQQQIGERLAAARAQGMTAPQPLTVMAPRPSPSSVPVPPGPPEPSMAPETVAAKPEPFNAPRVVEKPQTPKQISEQALSEHRAVINAAREANVELKPGDREALVKIVRSGVPAKDAVEALKASRDPAAELAKRLGTPSDAEMTFPPNKSGLPSKPPTARKARGKLSDLAVAE